MPRLRANRALGAWFEPSQYTAATIGDNRTVTSLTTNGLRIYPATLEVA